MKTQEQKDRFIIMRAEGKSYSTIAKELGITKSLPGKITPATLMNMLTNLLERV